MLHTPFADAFVSGARFARERGAPIEMETRVLGELQVPSGRLVVADPFITDFDKPSSPLARRAPTRKFPEACEKNGVNTWTWHVAGSARRTW